MSPITLHSTFLYHHICLLFLKGLRACDGKKQRSGKEGILRCHKIDLQVWLFCVKHAVSLSSPPLPLISPSHPTLSFHPFISPSHPTLSSHPLIPPSHFTLSFHPFISSFHLILSSHTFISSFYLTLLSHPFISPSPPFVSLSSLPSPLLPVSSSPTWTWGSWIVS